MNITNLLIRITQLPYYYLNTSKDFLQPKQSNQSILETPIFIDFFQYRNTYCLNTINTFSDKLEYMVKNNGVQDYLNDISFVEKIKNNLTFNNKEFTTNNYELYSTAKNENFEFADKIDTLIIECPFNFEWLSTVQEIRILENEISKITNRHILSVIEIRNSSCIEGFEVAKANKILLKTKEKLKNTIISNYAKQHTLKNYLENYKEIVYSIYKNDEKIIEFCNSKNKKYVAIDNATVIYSNVFYSALKYLHKMEQEIISLLPLCEECKNIYLNKTLN